MIRRMLINAQSPEEVRVAIVSDSTLDEYQVEVADQSLTRGNIYRGTIASVQPSLNAAFIDYGEGRHGFLSIQDVMPEAWYKQPKDKRRPKIEEVLERGRPIVVQVAKDAVGDKGAVLTTDLSLAGRYLVFTPFNDTRGVSRKVEDDGDRRRLKDAAKALDVPEGSGVIVRTNALGQTKSTLARDLAALLRLWKRVSVEARQGKSNKVLYSDQDLIFRALRDTLDNTITEIVVDDDEAHQRADRSLKAFVPRSAPKLVRYSERTPLFSKYDLEEQIAAIYQRRVSLPSGGSLVIDRTEALTAIDVNSGRSTKAASQEETAVNTNLEAAAEVARQLRLRDIGGLLVVDFIDMRATKNQRKVEKALRDAMKADKARSTVGRISANGLLEINRQRIRQALSVRTHRPCPTCSGTGHIPSPEMVSLNLLRQIETRAAAGGLERARIELHPELADAVQNTRRGEIVALEQEFDIRVEVIASSRLHRSEQEIEWVGAEVGKGRSRGRGRERPRPRPASRKPTVQASQLATERDERGKADEARSEDSGSGASGRRRSRRGGRKSRSARPSSEAPAAEATEAEAPASETPASEAPATEPKPRGSRRGSKRRPRREQSSASSEDRSASGSPEPEAAPAPSAPSGPSADAEPPKPKDTASQGPGETAPGDPSARESDSARRRRSRGGRRRRSTRDTEGSGNRSDGGSDDTTGGDA